VDSGDPWYCRSGDRRAGAKREEGGFTGHHVTGMARLPGSAVGGEAGRRTPVVLVSEPKESSHTR
jgi:hypothetical protein